MSALCSDGTSNHPVALFFHTFSGTKTANRFHTVSLVGGIPKRSVCDVVMGGSGFGRRRRFGMGWQRVRAMKAMRNGLAAGSGDEGDAKWVAAGSGDEGDLDGKVEEACQTCGFFVD